jgi:sialidase-1
MYSDDEGLSWSAPRDITAHITQKTDTRFHLPGPSHGIQLQKGPHTGRLLLQLWHRGEDVTRPREQRGYCASLLYSDDHGESWQHIPPLGHALCANESALCEIEGGVFWALRAFGTQHAFTQSADGGVTWDEVRAMPLPPAFACQAGLISLPSLENNGQTVLLSRVSRPEKECRRDMELCISHDGGNTFPGHLPLPTGDARPGYSDLCALDDGPAVGLLHCHEGEVLFTRIPLQALTDA